MSIKLNKKQLKQIVIEELEEIRTDGRGFGPAQMATAKALSNKGIATRPESVRTRLMQLVADLDLKNPTQEEIRQLADMVSDLMDAAQDADAAGLEESHSKDDEAKIIDIISQLRKASKMHAGQADELQALVDSTPDDELKEEEEVNEGMNCGCGNDPCKTYGKNNEKLIVMVKEELQAVLDEKKKKKACKPSKGKRFAKRVNGKCRSYGQKGQAKGGGDRIRPGTKKGDAYCARSAKIKKCKNPPCANALSRKKWKCRGSKSMKE